MVEEDRIGHQRRHRHDPPARAFFESIRQTPEIGNRVGLQSQFGDAVEEFRRGPAGRYGHLPLEQRFPDRMFARAETLPMLIDGEIVADFGMPCGKLSEGSHAHAPVR